MSIALDGFEVFRGFGKHPEVFAVIRADVDKAARALMVKCLKAKATGIDRLREIRKALGPDQFDLMLESLKDAEVKSILARLDKHHPQLKGGTATWRRQHLKALAEGSADPSSPQPKAARKAATAKKPSAKPKPQRLQSAVMDVFKDGGKHED